MVWRAGRQESRQLEEQRDPWVPCVCVWRGTVEKEQALTDVG